MSTNFFGPKKLKKYANKLGVTFTSGYEYAHEHGYKIHILENELLSFAVLVKKNDILDFKKIPKNQFNYIRISPDDKLYMLI
jgi:hypothetical protein